MSCYDASIGAQNLPFLEENDDEKDKKNAVDVETLHEWDSRVRKDLFSPRTPLIPFSYITHRN